MRRLGTIIAIGLFVGSQAVSASGSTPDAFDFRVQAGALPPGGATHPFAYTRFYPEHLQVHRGQTVLFETIEELRDLHTVSFWPGGDADRPPAFRYDEVPGTFALNEPIWKRSACGDPGDAPCRIDGSQEYLSSGLPPWGLMWRVTFDVPAGTTVSYLCQVHPGMTGSVEVVDDDTAFPSQAQIDAETEQQIAADTQEAIDHRALRESEVRRRAENGRTVWTVLVGDATPSGNVSILAYMPSRLEVRPGDAVEYVSAGIGHHSVTFPTELVGDYEQGPKARPFGSAVIHPACDADDPVSGAPGVPGLYEPFAPVSCPGSFELQISPWGGAPHRAPGDLILSPATYHDSGMMWSLDAPESARGRPAGSGEYFPHSFFAEFPVAGTFGYACTFHKADMMAGSIEVR